jgi:hypothetical protein
MQALAAALTVIRGKLQPGILILIECRIWTAIPPLLGLSTRNFERPDKQGLDARTGGV